MKKWQHRWKKDECSIKYKSQLYQIEHSKNTTLKHTMKKETNSKNKRNNLLCILSNLIYGKKLTETQ